MANEIGFIATNEGNQTSRVYDISASFGTLSEIQALVTNLALQNFTPATDVRYQWDEVDYNADKTAINNGAGYTAGATALVVDDASIFTAKDVVRVLRTGENMQITLVTVGTNTITVVRSVGATVAAALLDDDVLLNVGSAFEEASSKPTSNVRPTTTEYNYTQIFRELFSISGSKARTASTPWTDLASLSQIKADEFTRDIELGFIFGQRDQDTSTFSEVRHTTGGVWDTITTNVETVASTTITETAWNTFLVDKAFEKGSQEKFFICGDNYFDALSLWGRGYLQVDINIGALGISVAQYNAPTGQTLLLFNHPLFKGDATLAGYGMVIDPSQIGARYTQNPLAPDKNGRVVFRESIQDIGVDGVSNEYFAEMGVQLMNERRHAKILGVTGGA